MLGFTGQAISEMLDIQVNQQNISEITNNTNFTKIGNSINGYLNDLRLRAANLNIQHGDRLSYEDMKQTSRKIATDDPEKKYTEQKIADQLGISQQTVHDWIADIRAKQTASRNNLIYRLMFLGWTQQEIAEKTRLTDRTIRDIGTNTEIGKISAFIDDQLKKGNTIEQAADIDFHTLSPGPGPKKLGFFV